MVTQPGRRTAAALAAVWSGVITLATLWPAQDTVTLPALCVFCGQFGGVDFVLNVVLFIPLGAALRWRLGSWRRSVLVGAATTLVIETLQWRLIPGRDASLGDLLANTLGTMLGAWLATEGLRWITSTGETARRLTVAWGLFTAATLLASAVLLRPSATRWPQWVQWIPQRSNMGVFSGQLLDLELNGTPIHARDVLPPVRSLDAATRGVTVRATVSGVTRETHRRAYIARIANGDEEGFALEQRRHAVVFRTHLLAAHLRLHAIAVELPHAFPQPGHGSNGSSGVVRLEGRSDPGVMTVSSEGPGHTASVVLRRTVGLGWAMFVPWNLALGPAWWPANALWLATLMFPVAFLAGRSAHKTPDRRGRGFTWWPLAMVLATIAIVPATTGLSMPTAGEWLGVLLGVSTGLWPARQTISATRR